MKIVGIDFSITSPGLCISTDFEEFCFASIINAKVSDKRIREVQQSLDEHLNEHDDIFIKYPEDVPVRTDELYHVEQRKKLLNYVHISNEIVNEIKSHMMPGEDLLVAMEGISYGSKGSSLIDISMATGILRADILLNVLRGRANNFFVFTPSELKNAMGCKGNAPKDAVFDQFMNDPGIDAVRDSGLYLYLTENAGKPFVRRDTTIESPWNDMIDAYLAVKMIYNQLNKQ